MEHTERIYATIDLKSFYASVECMERGLDPMRTHLVVADAQRSEKTICLAVSPSLKEYGIPGRVRLFEVVQRIKEVNAERKWNAPGHVLQGASCDADVIRQCPHMAVDYIAAVPRMALYMEYSARIYNIYLNYVAPEDIHVYSIDEVFIELTNYLRVYQCTARELVKRMIQDVYKVTGITATAGLGSNLYLSKVAMDIVSKHTPADADGVCIAELDEQRYREQLWSHRPLTDFWRVGKGYAKKLEEKGLYTMGDIARCSVGTEQDFHNEELLY
ncbi:MAG: DNA methylase, partial [Peptococcaceae bacterium]|nr:DNA methylase [Peptococcaceae bacterium]